MGSSEDLPAAPLKPDMQMSDERVCNTVHAGVHKHGKAGPTGLPMLSTLLSRTMRRGGACSNESHRLSLSPHRNITSAKVKTVTEEDPCKAQEKYVSRSFLHIHLTGFILSHKLSHRDAFMQCPGGAQQKL